MRTWIWAALVGAACSGTSSEPDVDRAGAASAKAADVVISKAALTQFCSFMSTFSPVGLRGVAMENPDSLIYSNLLRGTFGTAR